MGNWSGSTSIRILEDRQRHKTIEYSARIDTVLKRSLKQDQREMLGEIIFHRNEKKEDGNKSDYYPRMQLNDALIAFQVCSALVKQGEPF